MDRSMSSSSENNTTVPNNDQQVVDKPLLNPFAEWVLIIVGTFLCACLILWIIRKIVQGPFYLKNNRIDGKVVIITGCNTGIGKETALELAKRGAKIYMACRDPIRCEDARLEIIEKSNNQNIYNRTLDLSSLRSVKKFADTFLKEESRLDILINNAGIMACPRGLTKDGFENQFGVNHLGHFYLTNLLLDTLKASAPSRIVVVSSAIYIFGKINKNDLMSEEGYTRFGAYSQSKLANILFTKYLAEQLKERMVTVNCLHPGIVKTRLSRHIIKSKTKLLISPVTRLFFKSPTAGAQTTIRLALDPSLDKTSGHYFFDCIRCPVLSKAKDTEMQQWLWNKSEELINSKLNLINEDEKNLEANDSINEKQLQKDSSDKIDVNVANSVSTEKINVEVINEK